jgi:hypothetical protein
MLKEGQTKRQVFCEHHFDNLAAANNFKRTTVLVDRLSLDSRCVQEKV